MTEAKDSSRIRKLPRKVPGGPTKKSTPLGPKLDDILVLVKWQVNTYSSLSETLNRKYRTTKDHVDSLVQREFLRRLEGSYPIRFLLSKGGQEYFQIYLSKFADPFKLVVRESDSEQGEEILSLYEKDDLVQRSKFAKSESLEKTAPISNSKVKVTRKRAKRDIFPLDSLRFRRLLEEYLANMPKDYPVNPILVNRAHWITYKFNILQQDNSLQRATSLGIVEGKLLAKSTWLPVDMKNWFKYQGWLSYNNSDFFVILTTKSVIIRFQTIFTRDPLETIDRILSHVHKAKATIETHFSSDKTKFFLGKVGPDLLAHCTLAHYGILLTPLAIVCNELGLILEDEQGRFKIDASNGVPEEEPIDPGFGIEDAVLRFADIAWQIRNNYGVKEAKQEIDQSQILVNKVNNQCLVLEDQNLLITQRFNTVESSISQIGQYLAETAKLVRDSEINNLDRYEKLEEDLTILEQRFKNFRLLKRPKIQQIILTFLEQNEREIGYTRNQLAELLEIPLGSASPHITKLAKEGVIIIKKEKNQAGRVFLNPTHLFNKFNKGESKI